MKELRLISLGEVPPGKRIFVRRLRGGRDFISRMTALGFTDDAQVQVIQNYGRGPLIALVRGVRVALAGQPNVGKSTVFNLLTGLTQHVGNWPGKTVEYKAGTYHHNGLAMQIVDLPGTYSLTANSLEERIARDFIIKDRPGVVVVIFNTAALERNLYLVAELLCLPAPLVLGLNMMDVAEQQGIQIEPHVLEAALSLPVVPLVATRNQGIRELMYAVERLASDPKTFAPSRPTIREDHQVVLDELHKLIAGQVPEPYPEVWVALKLLEGDEEITRIMQDRLLSEQWEKIHTILMQHEDAILAIAGGRYEWIGRMMRAAVIHPPTGQITLTDRLDRIATHPLLGLLLLAGIFGLVFWLTYTLASPAQAWLDKVIVGGSAGWIQQSFHSAPGWLVDLLADGVIAGAGTVLTLLPILVVFFTALSLLEDIGYLARAAYVIDRFMHPMGLHGKSCLALCLGFGCNVPAVLGARVVESERGRLLARFPEARTILEAGCARQGVILGVLNAGSRLGRQYKREGGPIWEGARFLTPDELKRMILKIIGEKTRVVWRTTLWPLWPGALPLPWGGFIGMAVKI